MKSSSHSISDSSSAAAVDELVPPAGGVGAGVKPPGKSEGPSAEAGMVKASAHASTHEASSLRIVDSPVVKVVGEGGGRRPARITVEYTACRQSDTELFCGMVRAGKFSEATALCNERLLTAADDPATIIWTKDASIVKLAEGRPSDALTLLASVRRLAVAEGIERRLRGKFENGMARTHERLGKPLVALDHFEIARHYLEGTPLVGHVDNNIGRLLTSMQSPQDSFKHFERALKAAKEAGDVLLEAEVLESSALAYEAQEDFREARRAALQSVELLEGTGYVLALEESRATLCRLVSRIRA